MAHTFDPRPVDTHSAVVAAQFPPVVLQSIHTTAGSGCIAAAVGVGNTDQRSRAEEEVEEDRRPSIRYRQ